MNIIDKAREFATKRHGETGKLYNGQPYIAHPTTVGVILALIGSDDNLIAAGYLHDLLEDTNTTWGELVNEFGEDVANLVREVTKDKNKNFPGLRTIRGLTLKAADNLANISSLLDTEPEKQKKLFFKYSYGFINQGDILKTAKKS